MYESFKKKIIILFVFIINENYYYNYKKFYHNNQINIQDPYNTNQPYHPKVIYFNKNWNGYKYWMAFTPYPYRNSTQENPCINVSNDLKKWISPKGLINPLDIQFQKGAYNSDTHLLYNQETKKLEIFWRFVNPPKIIIYTKNSKDGINWSNKIIFLKSDNMKKISFTSPTIIFENGIYKIWYVNKSKIHYIEKDKKKISRPRIININYKNNFKTWHIDVIFNKKKNIYEMITVAFLNWKLRQIMPLFYSYSKDNINWSFPIKILEKSKNISNFDSKGLYRSSLIYLNNAYFLFYSGHNYMNKVGIGLLFGKNIKNLRPYV